jgi:hypothetical protein
MFISFIFLSAAYIIFEKKLNLRTPVFWDAAGAEFLGGLFVTVRWLQILKIDRSLNFKNEYEISAQNFGRYPASNSRRPEASNEQL